MSLMLPLSNVWGESAGYLGVGLAATALLAADLLMLLGVATVTTVGSLRRLERWMLVLGGLVLVVIGAGMLLTSTNYPTDEAALTQGAARALLGGHDPYGMNLMSSLWAYGIPGLAHSTPLLNGQIVSSYSYPALPLLVVAPFLELTHGGQAVPIAYTLVLVLAMVLMFWQLPDDYRTLAVLICAGLGLLQIDGANSGMTQILAMTPLIYVASGWIGVGTASSFTPKAASIAVALGVALTANQVVWLMMPFLVSGIYLSAAGRQRHGVAALKRCGTFAAVALGTFLVINAPFIVWSPGAWLNGVTAPLAQHAVPLGEGLIDATLVGHIGGGDLVAYNHAALALLVALWFAYILWFRTLGRACFLLPLLALFVAARSLGSYWLLMIAVLVTSLASCEASALAGSLDLAADLRRPRVARILTGAVFAPVILFLALALGTPGPFVMRIVAMSGHRGAPEVSKLAVVVTNRSSRPAQPRFSVATEGQPLELPYWRTVSGPVQLRPGHTARYVIVATDGSLSQPMGTRFTVEAFTASPETISASTPATARP